MTIKLYGAPRTRSTRAVWALEEAGADYELCIVDLMRGEGRQPDYLAINPGGKVPALVTDDLTLTESAAICTWVGDHFPDSGLVPEPRTSQRALYDQWCFFVATELEQPLWTIAKHQFVLPKKHRAPAAIDAAYWEFDVAAEVFASRLGEQPYVLGDRFSAADILAAYTLLWAKASDITLEHENLESYRERMVSRPAFQRARAREGAAVEAKKSQQQ